MKDYTISCLLLWFEEEAWISWDHYAPHASLSIISIALHFGFISQLSFYAFDSSINQISCNFRTALTLSSPHSHGCPKTGAKTKVSEKQETPGLVWQFAFQVFVRLQVTWMFRHRHRRRLWTSEKCWFTIQTSTMGASTYAYWMLWKGKSSSWLTITSTTVATIARMIGSYSPSTWDVWSNIYVLILSIVATASSIKPIVTSHMETRFTWTGLRSHSIL